MTKYKYELMVGNSMAEMVHGTITQEQAYFWKKNFGAKYQDILHSYIYNFDKEEIDDSGIIPENYQLPHWHDIDDYEHLNAPYYNHALLTVHDKNGKKVGDFEVSEINQVVKVDGYMIEKYDYEPTINDKVSLIAYSHEKGSFTLLSYDDDMDNQTNHVQLKKPFNVKNMNFSCTLIESDVFITGATYNDDGNIIEFELESEYSHGKSSGTWIEEDTLTEEEVDVLMLDTNTKKKLLKLLGYEEDDEEYEIAVA